MQEHLFLSSHLIAAVSNAKTHYETGYLMQHIVASGREAGIVEIAAASLADESVTMHDASVVFSDSMSLSSASTDLNTRHTMNIDDNVDDINNNTPA
jgi:hypothetical protein